MSTDLPAEPTAPAPAALGLSRRQTAGWMLLTGASQGVRLIVTLLSAAVLSRLLKPEDFGLIATATPVFGFAMMLQNLGLAEALVQRHNLDKGHVNALFVITLSISVGFALVLGLAAPLIAAAFGQPRLVPIIWAMSGIAVITAGAAIPFGLLNRKLKFRQVAAIEIASSVAGAVAGIVFALLTLALTALNAVQRRPRACTAKPAVSGGTP
jgi:polysaccharide transporter, PST family